ncbi:hypothetical protein [Clostridium botulinum]|uniref:hypothetical protein n=1 Tax=Clostridium botulinum TaxID=1491 RepID=UPI00096FDD52|nr:hypothetical protein [Clostridium botulinum]
MNIYIYILKIQGHVLERDRLGYIAGADIKYYDDEGNEIENVFFLNKLSKNDNFILQNKVKEESIYEKFKSFLL